MHAGVLPACIGLSALVSERAYYKPLNSLLNSNTPHVCGGGFKSTTCVESGGRVLSLAVVCAQYLGVKAVCLWVEGGSLVCVGADATIYHESSSIFSSLGSYPCLDEPYFPSLALCLCMYIVHVRWLKKGHSRDMVLLLSVLA